MADEDSWASNSNQALSINLISTPSTASTPFNPTFTYPIFGEAELIYGYSSLSIDLHYASNLSIPPLLTVEYGEKNNNTSAKTDDVEEILMEFLPEDTFFGIERRQEWEELRNKTENLEAKPKGELVGEYKRKKKDKGKGKGRSNLFSSSSGDKKESTSGNENGNGGDDDNQRSFEIYRSTWETEGFKEFHRRVQIFALFYIEGASYLEEDESNWEFYTLFERIGSTYHFIGYTSLYTFYFYPSSSRIRLSQFLILPTHQTQKHGSELYNLVMNEVQKREGVTELTVEDPSEAFDRLRDSNDLRKLCGEGGVRDYLKEIGKLKAPIEKELSESQRRKYKIAPRQWSRLLELILLLSTDPSDAEQIKALRLVIKARIYRKNKDVLVQLQPEERKSKLQETYEGLLEGEYGPLTGVEVEPFLSPPETNGFEDGPPRKMARFA